MVLEVKARQLAFNKAETTSRTKSTKGSFLDLNWPVKLVLTDRFP